ncbi:MAG: exodeoxyribonuclease VII small subunit [Dissulfurispiraceae bacterium]
MNDSRQLTYGQSLNELKQIIAEIESEDIDVDALSEKVTRATYLIKFCKGRLRDTEEKVMKALSEMDDKSGSQGVLDQGVES